MHACSAGPEGRLACGEPSFTPTEHNHTCGELEHIRVAGFDVVMGGPMPARPMTVKESERLELPPHLIAEPVAIQTEYAELAAANHLSIPQAALSCGQMLELRAAPTATLPAPTSWPCATTCALSHPGLLGMVRRLNGLGYRLVVDTSLRQPLSSPASRGTHAAQELLVRHLATVGAYFSQRRRCIGIAADSTWHELIHEGCHATFDARVRCIGSLRGVRRGLRIGRVESSRRAAAAHRRRNHWTHSLPS